MLLSQDSLAQVQPTAEAEATLHPCIVQWDQDQVHPLWDFLAAFHLWVLWRQAVAFHRCPPQWEEIIVSLPALL
jgi:hypothetical protein